MAASYPASLKSFTVHTNNTDTIDAAHVNALQDEVAAVESTVGTAPNVSTTVSASSTFNKTSYTYTDVSSRLANIEKGITGDSHTQYVHNTGGDTITPSAIGVKGLIIKAASGQTANLLEFQNYAGTPTGVYVDSTGTLQGAALTGTIKIGSTTISLNGSTTTLAGVTLTSPTISSATITTTPWVLGVNNQSNISTYSFASTDLYGLVTITNASSVAVTVPSNLPSTAGYQLNIAQYGAGQLTISGATGVTIYSNGTSGLTKTRAQYSLLTLVCTDATSGANKWLAFGDLA